MAVPKLRFKEFDGDWSKKRLDSFLERTSNPVNVIDTQNYVQIGIRSHGKGIFHKESVTGKELGNKRVFWVVPNALVVNIVFAWERAIAVTSDKENGLIASHRFPMYLPKDGLSDVNFLRYMFITDKGQSYLELASPGGAGRNKTLGQSNFAELKIDLPIVEEQTKIASFLSAVDEKISQLTKKHELLSQYKQGMMQKLFSQQIRFKADDGSEFGEWVEWKFASCIDIFDNLRKPVSASERKVGFTPYYGANGIQSYIDGYTHEGEFILIAEDGANDLINYPVQYVNGKIWVNNHAHVVSGKQHIVDNKFLKYRLGSIDFTKYLVGGGRAKLNAGAMKEIAFLLPCLEEQTKIANFLSSIDQKIEVVAQQIEQAKTWKKGLLQQMFV
ncbi:restriction endonuclease subunit S [Acinetobacter thermotolerans]